MSVDESGISLVDLTPLVAELCWFEQRCFETLGAWSVVEGDASVAVAFATASRHHGWHAELLEAWLPTSPELGEHRAVTSPEGGWPEAFAELAQMQDPHDSALRLEMITRLLDPWIEQREGELLEVTGEVSEAPLRRWLRFIGLDHQEASTAWPGHVARVSGNVTRTSDRAALNRLVAMVTDS